MLQDRLGNQGAQLLASQVVARSRALLSVSHPDAPTPSTSYQDT
jgi:hypothetical protein